MSEIKLKRGDILEGFQNRQQRPKKKKKTYWERVVGVKSGDKYRTRDGESKYDKLSYSVGYSKHKLFTQRKSVSVQTTKHNSSCVHFGDIIEQVKKAS